jgi:thioesterase domain-containing protein
MARIQKVFEQDLPLAALFEEATVEHLAGMLRHQAVSASPSSLVAIQPSGARPPLFFVHPVGGSVLCYAALTYGLGADQPFYGFQASGLEGEMVPYTRVEDMAAHYLEAVLSTQPEGPYFLGGWSMGGVVAFEMAQQLRRQDREVALLALLDSLAPSNDQADRASGVFEGMHDAGVLLGFLRHLSGLFAKDATAAYNDISGDVDSLPPEQRLSYVWEWARGRGLVPSDVSLSRFQRLLRVYASNVQAVSSYSPEVYPGQITLFRATRGEGDPYLPDLGWGACSTRPVEVHTVSGDHYTMLSFPAVQALADQLRYFLNG